MRVCFNPEVLISWFSKVRNGVNLCHYNRVAVALGCTVYLWDADSGDIQQLCQTNQENEDDYITSVQWGGDGKHIAVGTNSAEVQIWDVARNKQVRTLRGHSARVGALAWNGGAVQV
jgi:cell division cycle protein 20 (cofactor of APC complex)